MRKTLVIITFSIVSFSVAQVSDFNTVDFTRADNIAKLNEGEDLDNLPVLAHKLTSNLKTDVEKFRLFTFGYAKTLQQILVKTIRFLNIKES